MKPHKAGHPNMVKWSKIITWRFNGDGIRGITFENLTLGGKPVRDPAFFRTTEFVSGLVFKPLPESGHRMPRQP
jgi:hypothetical protein